MPEVVVAAFYRFVRLPDYAQLRDLLHARCAQHELRGTILLAPEGINSTLAGRRDDIDSVMTFIRSDERLAGLEHKESIAAEMPFGRLKVKLKKEIVTMGVAETDPASLVGTYLDAAAWNDIISDPDVLVIDTRNEYEVAIGTFAHATSPATDTFSEFPAFVHRALADRKERKVALYCTGGIRCEKATSYLKANGFEQVFHLQGGILKYLETVSAGDNLWQGECFVFDERVSVNRNLQKGSYEMCQACGWPVSEADRATAQYVAGVSCPHCVDDAAVTAGPPAGDTSGSGTAHNA